MALPEYTGAIPEHHHVRPSVATSSVAYSSRPRLTYNHTRPYALHPASRASLAAPSHMTLGEVFEMHDVERRGALDAPSLRAALCFLGAVGIMLADARDLCATYGAVVDDGTFALEACAFPEFAALVRDLRMHGDLPPL